MPTKFPAATRCVLLMIAACASAFAAEPPLGTNVEGLLALAKARNPDVAAMRHEATAAQERALPAGALMPPRFKMELQDITRSDTQIPTLLPGRVGAAQYTLSQDLPWTGKRGLRSELAAREIDAAQARAVQVWLETAARIKAAYLQRYLVKATERLVSENLDLMLQLEKVLQVRYAGGLSAQQDITRIHVEHTGMRVELAALAGEWQVTQARLNALLARPLDAPLAAPEQLRPLPDRARLSLSALSERLRQTSPALQAASARVSSAEKTRDLTLKNRYPDFTLGVSAMQRRGTWNEWGLMLELNLPIQSDVLRAQERESEAMLASAQARQEAAANQALTDLSENLSALETARQTEHLMTFSLMPQAELTWRAALAGYENGKADFATLLDAQRQIRQARLGQLKSQVEAQLRLAEIERLIGEEV
ncbi:MAG: TolC family protein [Rhodoferax sp.]|uniref:TolC family protein n=1 Tax=Rhodoferax sp. TaxID=50421 RepID=UPI001B65E6B0|nr:TolC family protein [Rhodoferax sp.]MBP9905456.1 TolC family protein [Rhodoferax sp.]